MRTIEGLAELQRAVGEELGVSSWRAVTQESVNAFAEATDDRYWLHTDPERARATPLGSTVAHGLFTLSLGPSFTYEIVAFRGFPMTLNYGYEKVRFPAPLPVGSRVRMRCRLLEASPTGDGATARLAQTFEREGADKPVCVAEQVLRFMAAAS